MKKLAALMVLFSLGLFTIAPMVGCGGDDTKSKDKDKTTEKEKDK